MSVSSLSDLSRQHMLSILGYNSTGQSSQAGVGASLAASKNGGQLSPFAQILAQMQQVEQANPAQYSKMTQQISTNLLAASSSAQIRGNSTLAGQLTALSKDFAAASQTGQIPNVNDLASAMQTTGATVPASSVPTAPHMNPLQIIGNVIGKVSGII
jgi:hypothetical protein